MAKLGLAVRFAGRELRSGLSGFRVFLLCLALGVTAIAGVKSLASTVVDALRDDGRAILGGDIAVRQIYRPAEPDQLAFLNASGALSASAEMRAMARTTDGSDSVLVELKAVDGAYPLYGEMELAGAGSLARDLHGALARIDGIWGAVAEPTVLTRLGLAPGDRVRVGEAEFELRSAIAREPDRAGSGGFSLGPRLMISSEALEATGLIQPGSMIYYNYRLRLDEGADARTFGSELGRQFPEAGWRVRDFSDAAPQLRRMIERLGLFLSLVGLTALLVGGVGVGNAVKSYLDGRLATIATLKCPGRGGAAGVCHLSDPDRCARPLRYRHRPTGRGCDPVPYRPPGR